MPLPILCGGHSIGRPTFDRSRRYPLGLPLQCSTESRPHGSQFVTWEDLEIVRIGSPRASTAVHIAVEKAESGRNMVGRCSERRLDCSRHSGIREYRPATKVLRRAGLWLAAYE
jgi:hypothetical protein